MTIKLSIDEYESIKDKVVSISVAASMLNLKWHTLYSYLRKTAGFQVYAMPSSTEKKNELVITCNSINNFIELQETLKNFSTFKELFEASGRSKTFWLRFIERELPQGMLSTLFDKTIRVPKDFANQYLNQRTLRIEHITTEGIMDLFGFKTKAQVRSLVKVLGARTVVVDDNGHNVSAYSKEIALKFLGERNNEGKFLMENNYIGLPDIVKMFPYEKSEDSVRNLLSSGEVDGVIVRQYALGKELKYYIKREDIGRYIKDRVNSYRHLNLKDPVEILLEGIKEIEVDSDISWTMGFLKDFCKTKLLRSDATDKTKVEKARVFVLRYKFFSNLFDKEVYKYTDKELERLLLTDKLGHLDKSVLVSFLKSVKKNRACKFQETYNLQTKPRADEEIDIYEFSEFLSLYKYCKRLDIHVLRAIENRDYSVMWLYVATHLVNAWRHPDVIKLPKINAHDFGIDSFQDIVDGLSETQINGILMRIDKSRMVNLIVSKTKLSRTFFSNPSFRPALATAYAIADLHSEYERDETLLNFKTKYNDVYERFHSLFFHQLKFKFRSKKMNASLMSHLFYSIKNKKGTSYDAYQFGTRLRGHKTNPLTPDKQFSEVTKLYISEQYDDKRFDTTAMELFDRGEFGYLYALLLEGVKDESGKPLTITKETELIRKFQVKYKPLSMDRMAKFIQSRQAKKETIAQTILKLGNENICDVIRKIYLGEMSSREEDISCIIAPGCFYPQRKNCIGCEYSLPRGSASVMQSVKDDLDERLHSLINSTKWATGLRDMSTINALLDRLSEAKNEFGKNFVNGFIDLEDLTIKLELGSGRLEALERLKPKKEE